MFELRFPFNVNGVDQDLIVEARILGQMPAVRRGHPDTWAPAEGGELLIGNITNALLCPLPKKIQDSLKEDPYFIQAIERRLDD